MSLSLYSAFLVLGQFTFLLYLSLTGLIGVSVISGLFQCLGVSIALWGIISMRIGQFNIQPEVKASELVERGPYRWIRNPMYLGIFLIMIPSVIEHFTPIRLLALILLIIVLILKVKQEEKLLSIHFGEVYDVYKRKTKRFFPFIL